MVQHIGIRGRFPTPYYTFKYALCQLLYGPLRHIPEDTDSVVTQDRVGVDALNAVVSHKTNMPCETYSSPFMVNVLLQTVAVHTWMRYREYNRPKWNAFVAQLAKYSFGVYLVHVYVIDTLAYYGWSTVCFESVLSVPVVSVPVILISYAISAMIHRIPLLNKWIV